MNINIEEERKKSIWKKREKHQHLVNIHINNFIRRFF